ncbi:MAG: bifunctional methylenetetrahydrofolate dehydrogenase/methenyltetrahydrofolate cyclohydrolase FolD [candidate division NC10 bacterium]|nr:bifunctional methylenetetrahydrofolate dehydrogenase/methenyltetrahydrofolate cyclohydrolase FolD [candidate division NC10 bacterium]
MPARLIDGRAIAQRIRDEVKEEVLILREEFCVVPTLAVILVGDDPASVVYVRNKAKACGDVGIRSDQHLLPGDVSSEELLNLIESLNNDDAVHGILVQLPLPPHISERKVLEVVHPMKDVDGFHPQSLGGLLIGNPLFIASTPLGIMELLDQTGIGIEGKHAVVVGWSVIVGKPTAFLLLQRNATVTICHVKTADLAFHTRQADILIVAAGRPGLIHGSMVKEGAVVVDVGINRVGEKLVGDVDFNSVVEKASFVTPVPGGVGPVTVAMLLRNTLEAYKRACKR